MRPVSKHVDTILGEVMAEIRAKVAACKASKSFRIYMPTLINFSNLWLSLDL